ANRNVAALNDLINDLLDVTKIQSGQFNLRLQRTDLGQLVSQVIERLADQLQEAACRVELDLATGVIGFWDRSRLEQVLMNLISNSMKYAPNCVIRISSCLEGDQARLVVQDFGRGIPEKDQARIFEAFQRGGAADGETGGLGLGLFVVRQIINSHHGTIDLES